MTIPRTAKRLIATLAAAGSLGAAVVVGTATSASASTISNDYVQVCAQGDYQAYAQFPYRGGFETTIINPGTCWYAYMGGNSWEPINVYGLDYGKPIELGTYWYDGSVSGIGIGTEGDINSAYVYTW